MRSFTAALKASAFAALVFALAWLRSPLSLSMLAFIAGNFLLFGFIFSGLTLVIGFPVASAIEKLRIGRWWTYLICGVAAGALMGASLGHRSHGGEVENPHGGVFFSPWTRDKPMIDKFPDSPSEFYGSIAFSAIVGAALGTSFWWFFQAICVIGIASGAGSERISARFRCGHIPRSRGVLVNVWSYSPWI